MSIDRVPVLTAALLLSAVVSHAQTFTMPVPPPPGGAAGTHIFMGDPAEMQLDVMRPPGAGDLLFVEPLESGGLVSDAPYTADAVTETTQALADGNRISRKSSVAIARDGRGRERREHQAMVVGPMVARRSHALVTISDPVAGTAVTIDHERQLATRLKLRRWSAGAPGPAGAPPPGAPMAYPPAAVSAVGAAGATMAWTGSTGAGFKMAMPPMAPPGEGQTTALDPQTIEGLHAEGTRTTVTIPAGAIGNELPIEIVSERWYSPELKVVVLSRRADPRFGETVYRLTNLVRGEPNADLFEIPAGYRVDEPKLPPLPR